jgi:hypothetical protein
VVWTPTKSCASLARLKEGKQSLLFCRKEAKDFYFSANGTIQTMAGIVPLA